MGAEYCNNALRYKKSFPGCLDYSQLTVNTLVLTSKTVYADVKKAFGIIFGVDLQLLMKPGIITAHWENGYIVLGCQLIGQFQ